MFESASFKFDKEQLKVLNEITAKTYSHSDAETIRKSLNLMSTLNAATEKGYKIIIRSPNEEVEDQELTIR